MRKTIPRWQLSAGLTHGGSNKKLTHAHFLEVLTYP